MCIIQTDTTLQNYSADPKFKELFRLLRHDSCFYFMTAAPEFDADFTIMSSMMSIILLMLLISMRQTVATLTNIKKNRFYKQKNALL